MKQELRLSGTGGQGLITAGIILAEAALLDGKLAISPSLMARKPEAAPLKQRSLSLTKRSTSRK